jgi:hypothetical protein
VCRLGELDCGVDVGVVSTRWTRRRESCLAIPLGTAEIIPKVSSMEEEGSLAFLSSQC